jgi:hypothetical protein
MSSLSIATSAAGCCAYEVGNNTTEDKMMEAAMRFGAQASSLVVMVRNRSTNHQTTSRSSGRPQ